MSSLGMAGAGVAISPELNPAIRSAGSVGFAVVQEYGLPELTNSHFALSLASVRFYATSLRFEGYRESRATLAKPLPRQTGLSFEHQFHRADGFRAVHRFLPVVGLLRQVGPRTNVGAKLGRQSLALGLAHKLERWTFVLDVARIEDSFSPRIGWQAVLSPALGLVGGLSASPPVLAFGAVLHTGRLRVTLAFARHDPLGWTTGLEARWHFSH